MNLSDRHLQKNNTRFSPDKQQLPFLDKHLQKRNEIGARISPVSKHFGPFRQKLAVRSIRHQFRQTQSEPLRQSPAKRNIGLGINRSVIEVSGRHSRITADIIRVRK